MPGPLGVRSFVILRVDTALDGGAAPLHVLLRIAEGLAGRDAHHLAHQVHAGDELRHRVLDLQTRIHLEEVKLFVLAEQELERPRREVPDGFRTLHRDLAHLAHDVVVDRGARRLFDDLLVTALHRAIALVEVHHVAVAIAEDLDLDVPRLDDRLLEIHGRVAEGLLRFALCTLERMPELFFFVDEAHALAAAAGARLEHHRVADATGSGLRLVESVRVPAGDDGHASGRHLVAGGSLETHRAHRARRGTDERDARCLTRLGQGWVFREKAVAGVQRVAPGALRDVDELVDSQVALGREGGADVVRLVRHADVQRLAIGVAVDGDGADPHFVQGARDAHGNFASIRDENLTEHRAPHSASSGERECVDPGPALRVPQFGFCVGIPASVQPLMPSGRTLTSM
jgi:hypothetical protein